MRRRGWTGGFWVALLRLSAMATGDDDTGAVSRRVAVNGSSPDSTWARAQAWAMLGLAQAAVHNRRIARRRTG